MGFRELCLAFLVVAATSAQNYRVCISSSSPALCQSLDRDGSQATCESVESRVDCAMKLARGVADIGYFSEEEMMLLSQQQPNDNRVVATVRDVSRLEPFAFEAVAVVPNSHQNGFEGLRGGRYCHPGFDQVDLRWSPRVLKTLESSLPRVLTTCSNEDLAGKTAEQLEVEALNEFFSAACRPGFWSANSTVDASLKSQFPNLCSLCGDNTCSGYSSAMAVNIAGVNNNNRHIQALECLRVNSNDTTSSVAYVAWLHVREYFTTRNPQDAASFSLLCPDGSLQPLTSEVLGTTTAPCSFVKQPWGAVVASAANAANILTSIQTWWPTGSNPNDNSWQATLFTAVAGGANARVVFQDSPVNVLNYTAPIRTISNVATSCVPSRRWCTLSAQEQVKCQWVSAAANSLGIQPGISCEQRTDMFACLRDIRDERIDFVSSPSNYGYLARQHYKLTPVKMVQNQRASAARVVALVKDSAAQNNITRFENLRDGRACFPEYGGLAYIAFVRAAQERGVISSSECDYGKAVSEFFSSSCAPGAADASHTLTEASFDATNLCSLCKPAPNAPNTNNTICSYDWTNMYYGNNGSLACLADPGTDVAFVNIQNINNHLAALNLQGSQFRALCRNNTLAATAGVALDDNCALAVVVDAEVITRRNDPLFNSLNVLFDTLDLYFGYTAASGNQLINLEIFSSFNGVNDLLFKDSTIGLTEPTITSSHELARNYIELFQHLQTCTGSAPPAGGFANRSLYSIISLVLLSVFTLFLY